jgi:hypothetical protein
MTQSALATAAGRGLSTVVDYEKSRREVSPDAIDAMRRALEEAGVIFVAENGEGPGVRLRKAGAWKASGGSEMAIEIGDLVKLREDRPTDTKNVGKIGRIVDPGHPPISSGDRYVRFSDGSECWYFSGMLVIEQKGHPDEGLHPDELNASNDD